MELLWVFFPLPCEAEDADAVVRELRTERVTVLPAKGRNAVERGIAEHFYDQE